MKVGTGLMKKPKWLPWSSEETPHPTKRDDLKEVRRRTDQRLRQQDQRKQAPEAVEKKKTPR
jgi:hypothetical protein